MVVRVISRTAKYDHITPVFLDVLWLKIQWYINYETILSVFKYLHNVTAPYLVDFLTMKSGQYLQSSRKSKLPIIRSGTRLVRN